MPFAHYKLVNVEHWPNGVFKGSTERWWNTQPRPYIAAGQYAFSRLYMLSAEFFDGREYYPSPGPFPTLDNSSVRNKAYEQVMASLGDQSSWGTNLAEVGQSVSTCENRLLQLGQFAGCLRNKNFGGAAQALKSAVIPPGVSAKKAFSDNFLEWHFGWQPAVQDIHDACQTMSKADFGSHKIRGSSTDRVSWDIKNGPDDNYTRDTSSFTLSAKMGGTVSISNESAYLASQMGLVNPLTVAWDLVPYSFVVDWFANVGQVLGAVTGFVGLNLTGAYTTYSQQSQQVYKQFQMAYNPSTGQVEPYWSVWTKEGFNVSRDPGIAGPVLALKPFHGFSPVRAATACALLLQKL